MRRRADAGDGGQHFLGHHREVRHGFVASRQHILNATGITRFDELCLEHNGVVGHLEGGIAALVERLPRDWDEIVLPAVSPAAIGHAAGLQIDRAALAPYVDLAKVRACGYLPVLGASTRAQLRRARKSCGPLRIERADTARDALAIYDELVALHGANWRARNDAGAFVDPWFDAFHRRLITERFAAREIELVRIRASDRTLGCLYNFVWRGRVVFYQSGISAPRDPHDKPGYLCHAEAIEAAAAAGRDIYDFGSGSTEYKQRLATDAVTLVWARIQRPRVRFAIERQLRAWKHQRGAPFANGRPDDRLAATVR